MKKFLPGLLVLSLTFVGCEYHCIVDGQSFKMEEAKDREQASEQCQRQSADVVTENFRARGPLKAPYQILEIVHKKDKSQEWEVFESGTAYARVTLYCHLDRHEEFKVVVSEMRRSYSQLVEDCRDAAERAAYRLARRYEYEGRSDTAYVHWEFRRYFWDTDFWQDGPDGVEWY